MVSIDYNTTYNTLRGEIRAICERFPQSYWRKLDQEEAYPTDFVNALTKSGYLSALIPKEYGGLGMTIAEASVILQEIHRSGGNSAACHAQMYTMGALLRHGSQTQKQRYLPDIASGKLRLQAFSITEAEAGSDTTRIKTFARREDDHYVVSGHKNWTSRIEQSDLLMLLARTTPRDAVQKHTDGISLFIIDLRDVRANQPDTLQIQTVRTMFNYATYQVTYDEMRIPADALIGEEGHGFRYVIDGWNAERILLAAECLGDGYWFIEKAVNYANAVERFGAPIGRNQGLQFPIADAYAKVRAADLMHCEAARLFDAGSSCGAEANMAKYLASEASWLAANICLDTHGGNGFVDKYDVERKFRETRLYKVAPVSNNMILAYLGNHVLGMPKSY